MSEFGELNSGLQSSGQELRALILDSGNFNLLLSSSREDQSNEPGSFVSDLVAPGMPEPGCTATDDNLRAYFGYFAPGNEAIREMRFADAAAFYRWLAAGTIGAPWCSRYLAIARQLDLTQRMKHVCRGSLSFPPTGEEVESYFEALGASTVGEIQAAFEDYVDSFFVLSQVVSSELDVSATQDATEPEWCTQIPATWEMIQSGRLQDEGRRALDPVGHALLGKKCLEAAGFSGGHFAVASRRVDLNQGDSVSTCLMFTTGRVARDSRHWSEDPHIEVIVVANGRLRWAAAVSALDVEAAEELLFWSAFQEALNAPLNQGGKIAPERVVRLGSRGHHLGSIGEGATAVRVFICYPVEQLSNPHK